MKRMLSKIGVQALEKPDLEGKLTDTEFDFDVYFCGDNEDADNPIPYSEFLANEGLTEEKPSKIPYFKSIPEMAEKMDEVRRYLSENHLYVTNQNPDLIDMAGYHPECIMIRSLTHDEMRELFSELYQRIKPEQK